MTPEEFGAWLAKAKRGEICVYAVLDYREDMQPQRNAQGLVMIAANNAFEKGAIEIYQRPDDKAPTGTASTVGGNHMSQRAQADEDRRLRRWELIARRR